MGSTNEGVVPMSSILLWFVESRAPALTAQSAPSTRVAFTATSIPVFRIFPTFSIWADQLPPLGGWVTGRRASLVI